MPDLPQPLQQRHIHLVAGGRATAAAALAHDAQQADGAELAQRALDKFGLAREQLIINSSHNHAGPVTGDLLHLYYELSTPDLEAIERYTAWLLDKIESVIGDALADLQPATLEYEQGLCGFGVNRRRSRGENSKALSQVVDQDVPVLCARDESRNLRAIVFGYACHPTSYAVPQLSGDWPGFAQIEIEKQFPGACAMFVAGCGGDINPVRYKDVHQPRSAEPLGNMLGLSTLRAVRAIKCEAAGPLVIRNEKLEHHIARHLRALGRGVDLHAGSRFAQTACREHALAFDVDHASATIAVRPVTRLRRVAQMRDVDPFALRDLPDRLVGVRRHVAPVEREGDGVVAGRHVFVVAARHRITTSPMASSAPRENT